MQIKDRTFTLLLLIMSPLVGQVITEDYSYSVTLNNTIYANGDTVVATMEMTNLSGDTIRFENPSWLDWVLISESGEAIDGLMTTGMTNQYVIPPQGSLMEIWTSRYNWSPEDCVQAGTQYWLMKPTYNYEMNVWDSSSIEYLSNPSALDHEVSIPTYRVYQPHPNPANPSIRLSYSLSDVSQVRITLLNILGRELNMILENELNPGEYFFDYDVSKYPSGVYLVKYEIGSDSIVKKMSVVK